MDTMTHNPAPGPEFVLYLLGKTRIWSLLHEISQRLLEQTPGSNPMRLQVRMQPQPEGYFLFCLHVWGNAPERCLHLLQTQLPHGSRMEIQSMEVLHLQDYQKNGLLLIWAHSPWAVWIEAGLTREEVEACIHQIAWPLTPGNWGLSRREMNVLEGLRDGLSYEGIATRNFVTLGTIKTQIHSIYNKLRVRNKLDAIRKVFGSDWCDIS